MVTQMVIQMAIKMEIQMDTEMELPVIGNLLEITKLGAFLKYSFREGFIKKKVGIFPIG